MRFLLVTWGSRGDVEPLAGLAVRLHELGAEASIAAPPDEEIAALLRRNGIPHVPLGPTVASIVASDKPPSAQDAFALAAKLVDARFEALLPAAEGCEAVLATGLMPAGVRDVADKLGIRYVLAAFHVLGFPSDTRPPSRRPGKASAEDETDLEVLWREDAERVDALYAAPTNAGRARLGLPPIENIRDHVHGDGPVLLAADPLLGPWTGTTRKDLVQTGAWFLPDDRPLPDDLADFLDAGEPPVYVGFGSLGMHSTPDLGRIAVEAVRAQGRRVVLSRGWAGLTADDADDCFVIGESNHKALFSRVAAVVHHGGAGTTSTAALIGAPQVVVPQYADQPSWAARVADLGIGVAHPGPVPTVESLSAALAQALAPETAARAKEVSGQISREGTTVAAKYLINGG